VLCVGLLAFGVDNVFFGSVYFAARMAVAKGLVVLQPLWWRCVDCVVHHEQDEREEQKYICVVRASNGKRDCEA